MRKWNTNTVLYVFGFIGILLMFVLVGVLSKIYGALAAIVAVTVV